MRLGPRRIGFVAVFFLAAAVHAEEADDYKCLRFTAMPNLPDIYRTAPQLHELAAQLPEALKACEQGVRIRPQEGRMYAALGRLQSMAGDNKTALESARKGAELGDSEARILLGVLIARAGDYPGANEQFKAARIFRESLSNYNQGVLWANGLGVGPSNQDATNFFRSAARGGDPVAMMAVGESYARGRGVAADRAEAEAWWKKAAEMLQPEGAANPLRLAIGNPIIDSTALLSWYESQAKAGKPWAQAWMGALYESGQWVSRDPSAAVFWHERAGAAGHAPSQARMSAYYRQGFGVAKDPVESTRWGEMPEIASCQALVAPLAGVDDCDRYASDPYAPDRAARGVHGRCLQRHAPEAIAACRRSTNEHPSTQRYRAQLARALAHADQFSEARSHALAAANKGYSPAMILLGALSERGLGVAKDGAAAVAWYRKAAEVGDMRGAHFLIGSGQRGVGVAVGSPEASALIEAGRRRLTEAPPQRAPTIAERAQAGDREAQHNYAFSFEREKNYAEAIKWYERSAAQGYQSSAMSLAQMYENGIGVEKNPAEAMARYKRLADEGNSEARYRMATLYAGNERKRDAVTVLQKSVEHGDYRAMLDLGEMYERGDAVPKDLARAAVFYERAAPSSRWAQAKIGAMALAGEGIPRDYKKALHYLEAAANAGDPTAHNNLGQMYERGLGVAVDIGKAVDHYLRADGVPQALWNLDRIYEKDVGTPADPAKAAAWYRRGAIAGVASAQWRLGRLYVNGKGVAKDDTEAARWLGAAARQGHAGARAEAGDAYHALAQSYLLRGDVLNAQQMLMEAVACCRHAASIAQLKLRSGPAWLHVAPLVMNEPLRPRSTPLEGLSTAMVEDTQRKLQVRSAGTGGVSAVAAGDAGIGNVYTVIPWTKTDQTMREAATK